MAYVDLHCIHCGSKQKLFVGPHAEKVGCSACAKDIPIEKLIEVATKEIERAVANEEHAKVVQAAAEKEWSEKEKHKQRSPKRR